MDTEQIAPDPGDLSSSARIRGWADRHGSWMSWSKASLCQEPFRVFFEAGAGRV